MEVHAHTHTPQKKWTHYFWKPLLLRNKLILYISQLKWNDATIKL